MRLALARRLGRATGLSVRDLVHRCLRPLCHRGLAPVCEDLPLARADYRRHQCPLSLTSSDFPSSPMADAIRPIAAAVRLLRTYAALPRDSEECCLRPLLVPSVLLNTI